MSRRSMVILALVAIAVLAFPALALADATNPSNNTQVLSADELYALLIGGGVSLIGYTINHFAPWVTERAKAIAQITFSVTAGVAYAQVQANSFAFDAPHLQLVLATVFGALSAHHLLWKTTELNKLFGAGRNAQDA